MIPVQLPTIMNTQIADQFFGKRKYLAIDSTTPANKKRRMNVKKSVRFSDKIDIAYRPCLSQEDLQHSWYQDRDYRVFKQDIRSTIIAMNNSSGDFNSLDVNHHCFRGLERQISVYIFGESSNPVKGIIKQVLMVQHLQHQMAKTDPEELMVFYAMLSSEYRRKALRIAAIDTST